MSYISRTQATKRFTQLRSYPGSPRRGKNMYIKKIRGINISKSEASNNVLDRWTGTTTQLNHKSLHSPVPITVETRSQPCPKTELISSPSRMEPLKPGRRQRRRQHRPDRTSRKGQGRRCRPGWRRGSRRHRGHRCDR